MKEMYKASFHKECCKLATERCEDVQIEGFAEYPNCLEIYCRKCWNEVIGEGDEKEEKVNAN